MPTQSLRSPRQHGQKQRTEGRPPRILILSDSVSNDDNLARFYLGSSLSRAPKPKTEGLCSGIRLDPWLEYAGHVERAYTRGRETEAIKPRYVSLVRTQLEIAEQRVPVNGNVFVQ